MPLVCVGGGGGEETAAGLGRWRPVLCGGKIFGRTVARDKQATVLILGETIVKQIVIESLGCHRQYSARY